MEKTPGGKMAFKGYHPAAVQTIFKIPNFSPLFSVLRYVTFASLGFHRTQYVDVAPTDNRSYP
jgi:hypothetical protein